MTFSRRLIVSGTLGKCEAMIHAGAESRASAFATSIAALSMSASAPRFDVVASNAVVGLQGCERKAELPFHRAR